MAVANTRKNSEIWLVGYTKPNLPSNVLPTLGEVLKTYFHEHIVEEKSVVESIKVVIDELIVIWDNAGIPTSLQKKHYKKVKNNNKGL